MSQSNLKLSVIITGVDKLSAPLRAMLGQIKTLNAPVAQITGSVASLTKTTAALGAATAGLGFLVVKNQLLDTSAQFEKFESVLTTLEGSSTKAKQSMAWISDFAATTPFEFAEVTDAFVKLRAYGLDPTIGLMRTLGDTAAAMGKPIMQAVEAISDAVTGENERLKEFGIRASVDAKHNQTTYSFVQNGKTIEKMVNNRNQAIVQSTLEAIWNAKYAGSMAIQSKTWNGMMSNLEDQITRTKVNIMNAGLFDWMKGKLGGLLALIDGMAADGSLQRWAASVGANLQLGFEKGWAAGKKLYQLIDDLANRVGGFGNLAKIALGTVAAIMAGPLLLALAQLTQGMVILTGMFVANPILLAITGIGVAIYLLVTQWDNLVNAFMTGVSNIASWLTDGLLGAVRAVIDGILGIDRAIKNAYRYLNPFQSGPALSKPVPTLTNTVGGKADVGGTVKIEIDGPARVKSVKANHPAVDFNVDTGLIMPGAR